MSVLALILAAATSTAGGALEQGKADFDWLFATPAEHDWSLRFGWGVQLFEGAAGESSGAMLFRAALHRSLGEWLSASIVTDYSRLTRSAANLETSNVQVLAGAGLGFSHWISRFRLDLGVEGGALLRRASLTDGAGIDEASFRIDPGLGVVGGAGIAIRGVALFGVQASLRYQPGRTHFLLWLALDGLFGF